MPPAVVPVPLLTSQAQSAHPFLLGSNFQTKRSKNIWIDERGRVRRRPALHFISDGFSTNYVTGFLNYEYRGKGSRTVDQLVAFFEPHESAIQDKFAGAVMVSDHVFDPYRRNNTITGPTEPFRTTRVKLHGTITVHSLPQTNNVGLGTPSNSFLHRETVEIFSSSTTSSDGTSFGEIGEVWVDNIDYSTGSGELIIRHRALFESAILYTAGINNVRIVGATTGGNVSFTVATAQQRARNIWVADGWSESDASGTVWPMDSVPVMQQFGRAIAIVDDSYRYPLRIWTGGYFTGASVPGAPRGKVMTAHQGRLVIGGLEDNGSELVASATLDPYNWNVNTTSFNGAISLTIEEGDRSEVTGLYGDFFGDLIVFKKNSTHRITGQLINDTTGVGSLPFARVTVSATVGCAAHRTISQAGNDLIWMSSRGVHSLITTQKYGDIEEAYLSSSISEIFESIAAGSIRKSQAVFEPRLGLYLLGIPVKGSRHLNRLLAYSVANQRWMVWDIGDFTAIGLGPGIGGYANSVYVSLAKNQVVENTNSSANVAVLNFRFQQDLDIGTRASFKDYPTSVAIPCILEPGEVFSSQSEDAVRYARKSAKRAQFYIAPSGDFTSLVKYSWDGGTEYTERLNVNPSKDPSLGTGFVLGGTSIEGSEMGSQDQTSVSSVPLRGAGHTMRIRVEDSNFGHLPYLHLDILADLHGPMYTPSVSVD